ncbi:MAG: hypothetical protein QMD05_08955 [Candidatus Brocadiaceae bacterium]|nr:hypothetical protein [Candidatus Brocadiaceae bacterium]
MHLGITYYKKGEREEAIRCLGLAREMFEVNIARGAMPRGHPWYKECLEWIGKVGK